MLRNNKFHKLRFTTRVVMCSALICGMVSCVGSSSKGDKQNSAGTEKKEIQYPRVISLGDSINNFREKKLSEIADSVEYIKLENTTKSFVARPWAVHICDSFIFVAQYKSMLQFDRKGKFIRQIGRLGRGPKEYSHVYNAVIDRDKRLVYVNAGESHKIQKYDFNGEHKGYCKYTSNNSFEMLDSNKVVSVIGNYHGDEPNKMIITNPKMDTLTTLLNTIKFPHQKKTMMIMGDYDSHFYRCKNILHTLPTYGDTIFQVKGVNSILPRYVIDKGKYKLPVDCRFELVQDFKKFKRRASKYIKTVVHEIDGYVLINYMPATLGGQLKMALYDKQSEQLFSVGNDQAKEYGFKNDLEDFDTFLPMFVEDDKYLVNYGSAIHYYDEYQKYLEKQKQGDTLAHPKANYLNFMKNLKKDDNLVIHLAHLKK